MRAVRLPEGHLALAGGAGRSGERVGGEVFGQVFFQRHCVDALLSPWAIQSLGNAVKRVTHAEVHLQGDPRQRQRAPGSELLVPASAPVHHLLAHGSETGMICPPSLAWVVPVEGHPVCE